MKQHAHFIKKLALLAFSASLSLLVLEFAVRIFFPFYQPDRQIVFYANEQGVPLGPAGQTVPQRTPKGDYDLSITFNQLGFRDSKDLAHSTADDWFALGDSFALGWGVEETNRFSTIIDGLLTSSVYNISIPTDIAGYNLLYTYAEQHGATISNVLLSVCMENDLRDYYATSTNAVPATKNSLKYLLRSHAKSHSALYLFLSYELQQSKLTRNLLEKIGVSRKVDSDELMYKNQLNEKALQYSIDLLDAVASRPARVLVLIIPSRALWLGSNRQVESEVHERFVSAVRQKGYEVVDMRAAFESTGNPMQFYFANDAHWNDAGHVLAAKAVADIIQAE